MARSPKSWGFPRWGEYGQDRDTVSVRMCDYHGCQEKADYPAPKAPLTDDKWWFCQNHAAEYNKNWDFFAGMSAEEAKRYAHADKRTGAGYSQTGTYSWGGAEDSDGLTAIEREALDVLGLEVDASAGEIKARFRALAKKYHPDRTGDDSDAAEMFQKVGAAYEVLKMKLEARSFKGL